MMQIFFVLRKKDSQVTFLHLYHHSLTPLETWICVKFIAGGHGTLGNLINNAVHVVMYAYYMLSAMGPEYQKYLWWKKHLTTVQLVSFDISCLRTFKTFFRVINIFSEPRFLTVRNKIAHYISSPKTDFRRIVAL